MSRVLLICHVTAETGIGHLSRLLAVADELQKYNNIRIEFMIFGSLLKEKQLANYKSYNLSFDADLIKETNNIEAINHYDAMIFDLYPKCNNYNFDELFTHLKKKNTFLISIDSLIDYKNILDIVWIPSFSFNFRKHTDASNKIKSGWGSLLLQKKLQHRDWLPGQKVLVLTGGSDTTNLGDTLPTQLDIFLNDDVEVHWVKGPFSSKPNLPDRRNLKWIIHDSPEQLDELIIQSNYVISIYGVSLFEVLQYGVPAVTFSPYGGKDEIELKALAKEGVAMVAENSRQAIDRLIELMNNDELAKQFSENSLNIMSNDGAKNLSSQIYSLIGRQ